MAEIGGFFIAAQRYLVDCSSADSLKTGSTESGTVEFLEIVVVLAPVNAKSLASTPKPEQACFAVDATGRFVTVRYGGSERFSQEQYLML